jgi:HAMP domain-containing protein
MGFPEILHVDSIHLHYPVHPSLQTPQIVCLWLVTDADDGDVIGYVLPFYVTTPLDEQELQFLDRVEQVLLVNTALAVILIVGVGALLSRGLNAPLQRLADAARAVAAGDLEQQVEAGGSVEIARWGRLLTK